MSGSNGVFLDLVADEAPERAALWHLAMYRGLRRGELAGLSWTEVYFDRSTIEVSTQLTEVEREVEESEPKTAAGRRQVSVDVEGMRLLRALRAWQRKEQLRLGTAWQSSGLVFTRPDGAPLRPSWIGERFAQLLRKAGLPPIRLHDVRHTAATLMLAAGNDLKVVQETLGHAALWVTSDIYTSVLPEIAQAAAEATAAIVPRKTAGHTTGTHGSQPPVQRAVVSGAQH